MSSQRYSCDRCRQHKVRCLKISGELQLPGGGDQRGNGETCERCAKAEVPCVYSSRQKKGRANSHRLRRDSTLTRSMPFAQDLAGLWSVGSDGGGSIGDLTMPFLDMPEMNMPDFEESDFYGWDNTNPTPSSMSATLADPIGSYGIGPQRPSSDSSKPTAKDGEGTVEDLIGQVMAVSTRAARATRQLDRGSNAGSPLMVSSPEINDAFEVANSLVQIVNSIPQDPKPGPETQVSQSQTDPNLTTGCGLIFLALASHQHVLALFKAICVSIQRSVGFKVAESEQQQPATVHGDGASCAQFVMVLQLIMHLVNRLGRCLRLDAGNSLAGPRAAGCLNGMAELTPRVEGEEEKGCAPSGFVDVAQDVLKRLPDEHARLKAIIQQLQTHMEERLNN